MFSQIFAAIYHYTAYLTGFRRIYASKLTSQQIKRKLLHKDLEFSSVTTKQQVLIKAVSIYHTDYNFLLFLVISQV